MARQSKIFRIIALSMLLVFFFTSISCASSRRAKRNYRKKCRECPAFSQAAEQQTPQTYDLAQAQ